MVLAVASLNVLVSFLICQHEVLKKTFWDQIPRGPVRIIPKSIPAKVVLSKDREKSGVLVMFSEHTVGLKGWEHSVPSVLHSSQVQLNKCWRLQVTGRNEVGNKKKSLPWREGFLGVKKTNTNESFNNKEVLISSVLEVKKRRLGAVGGLFWFSEKNFYKHTASLAALSLPPREFRQNFYRSFSELASPCLPLLFQKKSITDVEPAAQHGQIY